MVLGCGGGAVGTEDEAAPVVGDRGQDVEAEPQRVIPTIRLLGAGAEPVMVRVQVADDDEERAQGLMFRRHLAADAGMLFVFEEPKTASFWMKNTFIPLDVLFIGEDLTILGIVTDTVPLSEDSIEIDQPSRYVLEVNAGFVRTHGIVAGSEIELVGVSLSGESP
jgi:uncharacterized membrane protein (UPF0127 family)